MTSGTEDRDTASTSELWERLAVALRMSADTDETRTLDSLRSHMSELEQENERLRLEQDNAGFVPWAGAQDALDEYAAKVERLEQALRNLLTHTGICDQRHYPIGERIECRYVVEALTALGQEDTHVR